MVKVKATILKKAARIALIGGLLVLGVVGLSLADGGAPSPPSSSSSPSSGAGALAATSAVLFADVPQDHWALADLQFLAERGIITGLPNGQFQGDQPLTRYAAAALVARAIRFLQNNPDLITSKDMEVLQELIYKINDRLQEMGTELDQLKATGGVGDSAALRSLQTKVQQNAQAIQSLQSQVQISRTSASDLQQLRDQAQANFIIALAGLLVGIIGIALATM